jgi:hypothetical protein
MRGNLALERGRWREACDEYRTAMSLCESIASSAASSGSGEKVAVVVGVVDGEEEDDDDDDDLRRLELFDFFATRARNVIAPLLRYCHYELQVRGVPSPPPPSLLLLFSLILVRCQKNESTSHPIPPIV